MKNLIYKIFIEEIINKNLLHYNEDTGGIEGNIEPFLKRIVFFIYSYVVVGIILSGLLVYILKY